MQRKIVRCLLITVLLLWLPIQSWAAQTTGSIAIQLKQGGGAVTLYRAGDPVTGGYRLREEFGGGLIKEEDASSPALAQWLGETAGENGTQRLLDADCSAEFSRLEEGLYLVVQTESLPGYYPFRAFLVTLPYEGQWHISAEPKNSRMDLQSPDTGQNAEPFLGILGMVLSGGALFFLNRKQGRR